MSDAANPAEAATRMMQEMWKAFLPPTAAGSAASSAPNPFMPTPEMVRSMQNAFLSAMEENAERMMRTPQFLESMQKGMQESLAMQQQLRSFLQSNLEQSMPGAGMVGTPGASDVGPAIVAALQRIERSLDQLGERLDAVERSVKSPAPTGARGNGGRKGASA